MPDDVRVGNPSEWEPFVKRNAVFVERLPNLKNAFESILSRRFTSDEPVDTFVFVAGNMAIDDFLEILTLCGNSEGHGATKILRAMFERVVTLKYL